MKVILAKKLEMTQKFQESGEVVPVTAVQAGPCLVSQVKTLEKDGYEAVQIGFSPKKKVNKPMAGHLKNLENFAYLSEFRVKGINELAEMKRGDKISVEDFNVGDKVTITGVSKGKGFQGVVRRHGFHGSPASHGHKDQLRMPGSIGATGPAHVFKGTRMGGQMGNTQITVKNLKIVEIDKENNLLYIKGAVPGARNGLLQIKLAKAAKVEDIKSDTKPEDNKE